MNLEIEQEWKEDRERINRISEMLYDEEYDCFDIGEFAITLEQLATKYLYRFRASEVLRTKGIEEVAE